MKKKEKKKHADKHDVFFQTPRGTSVKLTFDKEYRAFKNFGGAWVSMALGSSDPVALQEYIEKNF